MLRQTKVFLLLCALALSCAALLQPASAQTHVPPITLRARTLPNGLVVYSAQDHSSPTVAIQVWYKVGSKDDPQGRSGFAHLFEHLMFKSTANMKDETMDTTTRSCRRTIWRRFYGPRPTEWARST